MTLGGMNIENCWLLSEHCFILTTYERSREKVKSSKSPHDWLKKCCNVIGTNNFYRAPSENIKDRVIHTDWENI